MRENTVTEILYYLSLSIVAKLIWNQRLEFISLTEYSNSYFDFQFFLQKNIHCLLFLTSNSKNISEIAFYTLGVQRSVIAFIGNEEVVFSRKRQKRIPVLTFSPVTNNHVCMRHVQVFMSIALKLNN